MKTVLFTCTLISTLMVSGTTLAAPRSHSDLLGPKRLGIAYKTFTVNPVNKQANSYSDRDNFSLDSNNQIKVIELSYQRRPSEKLSVKFDVAWGQSQHTNSQEIPSDSSAGDPTSDYQVDLKYSISALFRYRPMGVKTLTPFVSAGLNTISVELASHNREDIIEDVYGYGLIFGAGLEYELADDVNISLIYQKITNPEKTIKTRAVEASIAF